MEDTTIDRFILRKIQLKRNNGLVIDWGISMNQGQSEWEEKHGIDTPNMPHPDLTKLLNDLVEPLATHLNIDLPKEIEGEKPKFRIVVNTVEISGEGGDEAVKVKYFAKYSNGQKYTVTSPFIKLDEAYFGEESKIWTILENLGNEAFEYVFNSKYAQLSLFGKGSDDQAQDDSNDQTDDADDNSEE